MAHPLLHKFYHEILSYLILDVVIWWWNISYYFNIHPPTGTYIAILAVLVAIMTILPPKNDKSKAVLVFIFCCMTALEIHTLYIDRDNYDKQHAADRDKYDRQHTALVTEERNGFENIFAQFDALIERQEGLFSHQEKISKETLEKVKEREGALIPSNLPSPNTTGCNVPPKTLTLYIGSNVIGNMRFPFSLIHGKEIISLDKDKFGGFFISARIFDDRGNLVVHIDKNKFLATHAAFRTEKTKSNLIVYDYRDEVALSVHFINPYAIKIAGKIYSLDDGTKIIINDKEISIITKDGGRVSVYNNCIFKTSSVFGF